jgi:hypothetical protein
MLLEKNRIYSLKKQDPNRPVLVQVVDLTVSIMGPQGIVCVPAILMSTKESVLIPVGMLDYTPEEAKAKAVA